MFQGILCIAGASLLFGLIPTANKYVLLSGVSAECITFFSQSIIAVLSIIIALVTRNSLRVKRKQLFKLLVLGAIGMGGTTFLLSSATLLIPVGIATVLHFLYPTIVSVTMVALFGQHMSKYKLVAILCSISGMLLITNTKGGGGLQWTGVLLALCSSLTYSFYMISNEKGTINALSLIVKLAYTSMGSALAFGAIAEYNDAVRLPETGSAVLVLVVICGLGSLGAFYLITAGIKRIGASIASFVNMMEPITSVVVSAIVYREMPKLSMIAGMVLVLSAVFLVALDGLADTKRTANEQKGSPAVTSQTVMEQVPDTTTETPTGVSQR